MKRKELLIGQNCITPDCSGILSNALICKDYKTWRIYADEHLRTQKRYDDSLTSRNQCLHNFCSASGVMETGCSICLSQNRERTRSEIFYCETCGFFLDNVNKNFGFVEYWNDSSILFPHYNDFIKKLVDKLFAFYEDIEVSTQINREDFSSIELNFLKEKRWIDGNGYITQDGEKEIALKLYELQHPALERYLEQFSIKQEKFVYEDSKWCADKPINIPSINVVGERPIIFPDTQVLVGGIRNKSLDRFLETKPGTEIDPERATDNLYPILLVCNASIKGYLNQLVVSEFITRCFKEPKVSSTQKISLVYNLFTIIPFNPLLLKIGTAFSSTIRESYTKAVDIKDIYHYLFAKQNNVNLIISENKHFRYIKEFYEKLKETHVEIEACLKFANAFFNKFFPREANYYEQTKIETLFNDLFDPSQAVEILEPNAAKEKLRGMINEEEA